MDYYGISPSSDFFAHWGVKGMKWGIRKARSMGIGKIHSKAYSNAEKKLRMATYGGGLIGGAIYAHKHKDELNKSFGKASRKAKGVRVSLGNKAFINSLKTGTAPDKKPIGISIAAGNKEYIASARSKSPRRMYNEAMAAGKRYEDARKNLSALGRYGIGKTAKEYRSAQAASREATKAYYNSLSPKEYAKLRRRHIG